MFKRLTGGDKAGWAARLGHRYGPGAGVERGKDFDDSVIGPKGDALATFAITGGKAGHDGCMGVAAERLGGGLCGRHWQGKCGGQEDGLGEHQ